LPFNDFDFFFGKTIKSIDDLVDKPVSFLEFFFKRKLEPDPNSFFAWNNNYIYKNKNPILFENRLQVSAKVSRKP